MKILITGGRGFIGQALLEALVKRPILAGNNNKLRSINEVVLADRLDVPSLPDAPFPIHSETGDLEDDRFVNHLASRNFDTIFHLAASLTLDAEKEPSKAYSINVEALRGLVQGSSTRSRLVYASSIAVFGGQLPGIVNDALRPMPETTYGVHKAISELLVADYSRLGQIDGRSLRLPIVLIRAGSSTPSVSDEVAAIAREPLAGRDYVCGLRPSTLIPVASSFAVAAALVRLHDIPSTSLPQSRVMNLPSLTVSVAEIVATIESINNSQKLGKVSYALNVELQQIVDRWPKYFVSEFASSMGITADSCFREIVDHHLDSVRKALE